MSAVKGKKRERRLSRARRAAQALSGLAANAHLSGFVTGKIYQGPLKRFCVPGMNCYACPGAVGACPLGAFQSLLSARKPRVSLYVLGFLGVTGVLLGRFVCGWLCLFGLVQELLYSIPTPKLTVPEKVDKPLRYLKYVLLAVFVVLLPAALRDRFGLSTPYFCKLICPVGTLEGGIPLVLLDSSIRRAAHGLFAWKTAVLAVVTAAAVFIHRPFCRYMCPLGAFYSLFSRISFLRLKLDSGSCVGCGKCASVCGMKADPARNPDSAECIRCGECVSACPQNALSFAFAGKEFHGVRLKTTHRDDDNAPQAGE